MTLLHIKDISKSFGGLRALKSVNIRVAKGSVTALIGPNGAGKTTLLNIINGLLKNDEGAIFLEDKEITGLAPHEIAKHGISRTFQILNANQHLTVLEYLMLGRHLATRSGILSCMLSLPQSRAENKKTQNDAFDALGRFQLEEYAHETLSTLPHAIYRLVEITRALIGNPQIVLFDEPTSGLNPREVIGLGEAIKSIQQEGTTIFMIEHHMRLVMDVADWITVINFGQNLAEGTPSEIANNDKVIEAYLGRKDRATRA